MDGAWRLPATGMWSDWMPDWMIPFARTIDGAKKYVVPSTLDLRLVGRQELRSGAVALRYQPGRAAA